MCLFFVAPALPLFPYFWLDNVNWGWTPELISAISNKMNAEIASIISIGGAGIALGLQTSHSKLNLRLFSVSNYHANFRAFVLLTILALLLSEMSASVNFIFFGTYGGASLNTLATKINFPAAYLVSYAIIIALFCDAFFEKNPAVGEKKLRLSKLTLFYILIFTQILRGDREILGLLIALSIFYLATFDVERFGKLKFKKILKKMIIYASLGCLALLAIGILRFTLSYGIFGLNNLFKANPWIMALTSFPAYFASDIAGTYVYGKTYIQYVLSLPPGIITASLGVSRAIESNNNIATHLVETGLTSGGCHVALVMHSNFGILGVAVVSYIYSFLGSLVERKALKGSFAYIMLWLNIIAAIPIWFWYGEMTVIRAIMASIIVVYIFRLTLIRKHRAFQIA